MTGNVWFGSVCTGEEEEGGDAWDIVGETPRFSLGGTGGNDPPASDRDKLRLGLLLSALLSLQLGMVNLSERLQVNLLLGVGLSPEVKPSNRLKQMDSWESLLGGGGSGAGQKWTGVVLRRLKTVLGLGTGFASDLLLSELVSMVARFGAELFLNASKLTGPDSDAVPRPRSDEEMSVTD